MLVRGPYFGIRPGVNMARWLLETTPDYSEGDDIDEGLSNQPEKEDDEP